MSTLTNLAVKSAQPKEKPYRMAAGHGLYIEIAPSGSKYWRFKYRFAGKEKRLALGVYPEITLKEAEAAVMEARAKLRSGIDPGEVRRLEKIMRHESTANSFEAVAAEWVEKERPGWSAHHADRSRNLLKGKLFPWLGDRPISAITPQELLAVLRRTESKGTLETAHRAKYLAGQIFRYAIQTGRAEQDPSQALKGALKTPKEKHLAAITDPKEVGKLMLAIESFQGTPVVKAALEISPLVFQRPGEVRSMLWADIDFENAEWRYTVTKTNTPHIVPLSKQAVAILKALQPITSRSSYVFPSARGASRPLSENGVRVALRSLGYTNEQMSPHGFRAMARTILDEVLNYRVDWIEHQLAHAVRDANGRAYNRTSHLEGRKAMMQGWADYLDALKAEAKNGNVVVGKFFERASH